MFIYRMFFECRESENDASNSNFTSVYNDCDTSNMLPRVFKASDPEFAGRCLSADMQRKLRGKTSRCAQIFEEGLELDELWQNISEIADENSTAEECIHAARELLIVEDMQVNVMFFVVFRYSLSGTGSVEF